MQQRQVMQVNGPQRGAWRLLRALFASLVLGLAALGCFFGLKLTPEGPRIRLFEMVAMMRWPLRDRLGVDIFQPGRVEPPLVLAEAARGVPGGPKKIWWQPLDPEAPVRLDEQGTAAMQQHAQSDSARPLGRLPAAVIRDIVHRNFFPFRICYEDGLMTQPNLEGRIAVRFVIGRDGRVSEVSQEASELPTAVNQCIEDVFWTLRFPPPDGGIVRITYPLSFSPA